MITDHGIVKDRPVVNYVYLVWYSIHFNATGGV